MESNETLTDFNESSSTNENVETKNENNQTNQTNETTETKSLIDLDPESVESKDNQGNETDSKEAETPTEYTDFKLPEGFTLDEGIKNEFLLVAKDAKLSQEHAQKLVDIQTKYAQEQSAKVQAEFHKTVKDWQNETITFLGPEYKKELSYVSKAMAKYGTPELKTLLNTTGLGNNKEIVNAFRNIGKEMSDDTFIDGRKSTSEDSLAKRLYPNHN